MQFMIFPIDILKKINYYIYNHVACVLDPIYINKPFILIKTVHQVISIDSTNINYDYIDNITDMSKIDFIEKLL